MAKHSKQDPTGQRKQAKRATRALNARLKKAKKDAVDLFQAIPRTSTAQKKIINADTQVVYDYAITPTEQQVFAAAVLASLYSYLLESQTEIPPDWYWKKEIEQPYRQGTLEEANRFNVLIAGAAIASTRMGVQDQPFISEITPEQILSSLEYRQALQNFYVSDYQIIKSLSEKTAYQVTQVVNDGMAAGLTPSQIAKQISERFDVAQSGAERIAYTEVYKAYNNAKLNAVSVISKKTGLRAGVIHVSALLPTTRETHAARHGNAYTVTDQEQWWNTGANRINCKCSVISVLINEQGKVVQSQTQEEIKAERDYFTESK